MKSITFFDTSLKASYLFSIFILLTIAGRSQSPAFSNKKEFDYKGKVKSVLIEAFKPKYRGDSIVEIPYDKSLFAFENLKIFFGENGLIEGKEELKTTTEHSELEIDKIWTYHYSGGKLDSILRREADSSVYRGSWKFYYHYLNDSITYEDEDTGFRKTKRIKKSPNLETIDWLDSDSSILMTEFTYFDKLKRVEKYEVLNRGKLTYISLKYYPDSLSQKPVDEYAIDLEKNRITHSIHSYNENQEPIEWKFIDSRGNEIIRQTFEYHYDNNGNWIEKKVFNLNGRIINIYRQTFEYY